MKIKQKLLLGIGLLFGMILLLTVLSATFINKLNNETKNILVANYNSLDYCRKMQIALDNDLFAPSNQTLFERNLRLQEHNITEYGEKELTDRLTGSFNRLLNNRNDSATIQQVRKNISEIMLLNMLAIQRKSNMATATSDHAIFWVTLIGAICFLISLVLLFNLPGNVANPIREFTESIREIAAKNYSRRIHFQKKNEFGDLADSFNSMAEKLEEYQASNVQKLLIEKKRIETLINNMHDPVIGLDENKRILFMNDIALKISGMKPENVMGKAVQDIAMHNDLVRSLTRELFDESQPVQAKATIKIYADNKESYFEKEIIPIKIIPTGEKEEKSMGNVIILQNITPYKELDFAKTHFIATVSHELKTPISSIKMSLQLLDNSQIGPLNDEQRNLVDSIREDAARLLKIIGELLNMAQLESGSIQLSAMSVSPREMIDLAIQNNKAEADNKQISLEYFIAEGTPSVLADKDKTVWVLNNLLSNAIRYSYEHSSIVISAVPFNNQVQFSVTDTGQGILPQYIDKIFDRYFRIPGTQKDGTGLGLSISKEFIEAQGGTISVKSEFGSGSTFSFFLNSV